MKVYIFSEPEFSSSEWCLKILDSIIAEIRRLRKPFEVIRDYIADPIPEEEDFGIIISSNSFHIINTIKRLRPVFRQNLILVSTLTWLTINTNVKTVNENTAEIIRVIFDYLYQHGKKHAALYGVNQQSISDISKYSTFTLFNRNQQDVYFFKKHLQDCYQELAPRIKNYDAIICTNDVAAFSLLYHLRTDPTVPRPLPFLISCIGSELTSYSSPSFTTAEIDYSQYGPAVKCLIGITQKYPNQFSSVNIGIPSYLKIGETTGNLPYTPPVPGTPGPFGLLNEKTDLPRSADVNNERYYADTEGSEIMRLKSFFASADRTDLKIALSLYKRTPPKTLCTELFISESDFKYRLSQIKRRCRLHSTEEFRSILDKYMPQVSLPISDEEGESPSEKEE